jgi:thymidylate synthase (FAD)
MIPQHLQEFTEQVQVLDHGFIRLIDIMGDDSAIVQAARVSYGEGTKTVSEDQGLIRYLLRHGHTSPFEMCEIKIHVKCPIFVFRQWIRHRTASVNEISGRYSVLPDENYCPGTWNMQSEINNQGSGGPCNDSLRQKAMDNQKSVNNLSRGVYDYLISEGVSREQSRIVLPVSQYTEAYWKVDLHNLLHFLKLRMDSHAQPEIQAYAKVLGDIVEQWVPFTWKAFLDYQVNNMSLSALEIGAIALSKVNPGLGIEDILDKIGIMNKRERAEFLTKLTRLGWKTTLEK